jgi:hypothetical protein
MRETEREREIKKQRKRTCYFFWRNKLSLQLIYSSFLKNLPLHGHWWRTSMHHELITQLPLRYVNTATEADPRVGT